MTDTTETIEIPVNLLATEYDALFRAGTSGSDTEVLDAIRGMIDSCPEVAEYFAREAGITVGNLKRTLSLARDAMGFGQLDETFDDGETTVIGSFSSASVDIEAEDIDAMLDDAAAFGLLDEALEALEDEAPRSYEVITSELGIRGQTETSQGDLAARFGVSRQMVRRYRLRGYSRIRERLSATER